MVLTKETLKVLPLGDPILKIKYGDEEIPQTNDDVRKYLTYILISGVIALPIIGIILKTKKNRTKQNNKDVVQI
jgi:hypothetical protein